MNTNVASMNPSPAPTNFVELTADARRSVEDLVDRLRRCADHLVGPVPETKQAGVTLQSVPSGLLNAAEDDARSISRLVGDGHDMLNRIMHSLPEPQ